MNQPIRFSAVALLFFCTLLLPKTAISQTYKIPEGTQRIVFLGNSITYNGKFISFLDTYLRLKYPNEKLEIINVGLPSETVSGLSEPNHADGKFPRPDLRERLSRVLTQLQPDLILANYGMNDGIYLPFSEERIQAFKIGMDWLHQEAEKSGAEIIHVTPPIFDERKDPAYANVLDIYSDWLISRRYTDSWKVIDLHWPMRKKLEDMRDKKPDFAFARDAVHPDEFGHFIIAKELLMGLGEMDVQEYQSPETMFAQFPKGLEILGLIEQKQTILRDAWLRQTGHQRPGLPEGLTMQEAQSKVEEFEALISKLVTPRKTD